VNLRATIWTCRKLRSRNVENLLVNRSNRTVTSKGDTSLLEYNIPEPPERATQENTVNLALQNSKAFDRDLNTAESAYTHSSQVFQTGRQRRMVCRLLFSGWGMRNGGSSDPDHSTNDPDSPSSCSPS